MSERELRERVIDAMARAKPIDGTVDAFLEAAATAIIPLIRADERARTLEEVAKWYAAKDERYIPARFVAEHCRSNAFKGSGGIDD